MTIEEKIKSVDWKQYQGPEYYNPEELVQALLQLSAYDESKAKYGLDNKVLFAVGNNHAGTYYPAILEAAGIIIEMEKHSSLESVRKCAYAILNDLYYFEPELGSYDNHSAEDILKFVKLELNEYADET
nr:hypothetical protein [uncultured Undibacterium sp.]